MNRTGLTGGSLLTVAAARSAQNTTTTNQTGQRNRLSLRQTVITAGNISTVSPVGTGNSAISSQTGL